MLGASTGLMTETCFRLGLAQTYTHIHTCAKANTHLPMHTQGGGPVSLDNTFAHGKKSSGFCSGTVIIKEKTKETKGITHNFSHPFTLSFELQSISHLFPSVGLTD